MNISIVVDEEDILAAIDMWMRAQPVFNVVKDKPIFVSWKGGSLTLTPEGEKSYRVEPKI